MAIQTLSDISSVISTKFARQIARTVNRHAVTTALLPKVPVRAKNVSWDVRFPGATAAASYTEGTDVAEGEFTTDTDVPAVLNWGLYRKAFKLSGPALSAAAGSGVNSPEEIERLFEGHLNDCIQALADKINKDVIAGAGTTGLIHGLLNGALAASGSYAGIDPGTYTAWVSTVLANGGTVRPITKALLDQAEQALYEATGQSPTHILCSAAVAGKLENTAIDTITRNSPVGSPTNANDLAAILPQNMSGFTGMFYKGIPIFRDKDYLSSGNRNKMLVMLNAASGVEIQCLLPASGPMSSIPGMQSMGLMDSNGQLLNIPVSVEPLARTGDAMKFQAYTWLQLAVRRRNAHAVIQDIDIA